MSRLPFSPIDRARWFAVSKARELIEQQGGSTHRVGAEDALCELIMWAEEHPEDPAARWLKRKPSKLQKAAFIRDWAQLRS